MKLIRAGQLVNIETKEVENVLEFDSLTLTISDDQYQKLLNHMKLSSGPKKEIEVPDKRTGFYVNVKSAPEMIYEEKEETGAVGREAYEADEDGVFQI